jgi:hypothetical protein
VLAAAAAKADLERRHIPAFKVPAQRWRRMPVIVPSLKVTESQIGSGLFQASYVASLA